ncbi:sugar transferase [Williamsia sp. D3]|uniref:sugar transferase n=1 Tax=Williamsia sp. D3 TaxID=1313067 RepID=UPI0004CF7B6F
MSRRQGLPRTAWRPAEGASQLPSRVVKPREDHWASKYVTRVRWTDAVIVAAAVLVAQQIRFGGTDTLAAGMSLTSFVLTFCLFVAWTFALRATQSSDRRIVGDGPAEYSRVLNACFIVFGLLAIVDLAFRLSLARGFIAIALPLGTIGLLLSRWGWRKALHRSRLRRRNLSQVLVVGGQASAVPFIQHLGRNPGLGYEVVGVCVPPGSEHRPVTVEGKSVPVYGTFGEARDAVALCGATTVAVTSAEALGHSAMRELSWDLEGMNVDMLVSPGVVDVAGPRMMVRPVAGLPLLHIDKPRYDGANRFLKAAFDRLGALALIVVLTPVMLACAIAVKCGSKGPIFYRAERIGVSNMPFDMWKFRTMVDGADQRKAALAQKNEGSGVLFKLRDDPRVTATGKFLRRYSLDELPQLFNVLGGTMSLVGPRPPLRDEVEKYSGMVTRRMLVRPGMTGLWQVSGRSDLSWEESVRLDLTYVENWSIMQDAMILWRTARAVTKSEGAY